MERIDWSTEHPDTVPAIECLREGLCLAPAQHTQQLPGSPRAVRSRAWELDWSTFTELWDTVFSRDPRYEDRFGRWYGPETMESLTRKMSYGALDNLDEANRLLDQVDTEVDVSAFAPEWSASCVGSTPSVGAHMAGSPNSMFRYVEQQTRRPTRVFVSPSGSCMLKADDLRVLGIAAVATAMAISRVQPVEVVLFTHFAVGQARKSQTGSYPELILKLKLGTTPIDLSRLMFALTNTNVMRTACYGVCNHAFNVWGDSLPFPKLDVRKQLEVRDGDIVVSGMAYKEVHTVRKDPVAWVREQVDKALRGEDSEMTRIAKEYHP